ncbi:sensor histidine kinase [Thiovibrio sp. JS02]
MRKALFLFLLGLVVAIGLLHLFTPGHLIFYHNTFRRLSYFPIVLGGLWFGLRGGLFFSILSSIAFIPHVLMYMGQGPQAYLSELTEIILYLAAGALVGMISGRQMRLREKYQQLSEKLQASYGRLHQETGQLLEAEAQLAAAQKFSALGRMSASLAHEIKNPLASIRGTAEILQDEFPMGHPKREFVEILLKETTRLRDTVEEILRYSRGEGREKIGPLEPLSGVISHVCALLERQRQKKGVTLSLAALEEGHDFLVEGARISQVLLNLLLNALDAVAGQGRIWIMVERGEAGRKVVVCDDGPGVSNSEKEKIFEPFYSGKEEGTGLGLLISRKIVESYGGSLTVADHEGGGACFAMYLPERNGSALEWTT